MSGARVKRDVYISTGFCNACCIEVAVCAPASFVFGVLKCPWCTSACERPAGLPERSGEVAPYVANLHWWANVLTRFARDGGGERREPMRGRRES